MNAPETVGATPAESTALTVQARAQIALGTAEREKRLIELAKGSTAIVEIRDSASYQECHGARMSLKRARLEIEGQGERAREDARDFAKGVIAEQKRLIAIVEPEELRLQEIERAHDAKVEAEKEAKRKAEQERIALIQFHIDELKRYAIDAAGQSAANIATSMEALEKEQIDERFGEFRDAGEQTKVATMNRLNEMHAQAAEREAAAKAEAERLAAEQARIKAEREELERQKAAQAERERVERERVEAARIQQEGIERARQAKIAQEAQERVRAEAEAKARLEAEEAAARQRIEAAEAESRRRQEEVAATAKAAQERQEVEAKAAFDRQQAALKAEADRLAKERQAAEERERKKQEAIEAKARAKAENEEAARLEAERKALFAKDTEEAIVMLRRRIEGSRPHAGIATAIDAYLEKVKVPA